MSEQTMNQDHYVGPAQPPPNRPAPRSEVGLVGWARKNLFSSWQDTISTLITLAVLVWFFQMFIDWSVTQAQWEVIFLNLANLGAGPDFPKDEIWRVELSAYIVIALAALSFGFWWRLPRVTLPILGGILAAMYIIPWMVQPVEEPPIYYYIADDYNFRQSNFVANEGESYTFQIIPLLTAEQLQVGDVNGYIEDDNGLANTSWVSIAEATREVRRGNIDPQDFNLDVAIQIWDAEGNVIAESDYTDGQPEVLTLDWEVPEKGWYTMTVVQRRAEDTPQMGYAWLRAQGMEVFFSTVPETNRRDKEYGAQPELPCDECATSTNRTDLQYRGDRSIAQWFSLQLAPYLVAVREFFLIGTLISLVGYGLGWSALHYLESRKKLMGRLILVAWVASIFFQYYVLNASAPEVEVDNYGGLFLTLLLSVGAIIASFPIGVLLALGRQSDLPIVNLLSTIFIEVVRGVPLITLLFAGRYIVPFFVDGLQDVASAIRMWIVMTFFTAAYLAEVVRGGLQIIPSGQIEAARALGLNSLNITTLIILPQALRAVIPAIMGVFVSIFKDTSLVALIGLYEILGAMRRILQDTATGYAAFQREGYLYIAIIYFIFSYLLAVASRRLETSGSGATRRR